MSQARRRNPRAWDTVGRFIAGIAAAEEEGLVEVHGAPTLTLRGQEWLHERLAALDDPPDIAGDVGVVPFPCPRSVLAVVAVLAREKLAEAEDELAEAQADLERLKSGDDLSYVELLEIAERASDRRRTE